MEHYIIKENISKNIICNWSILQNKKYENNNDLHIISVAFFLRKNKKDNRKYIDGIKHIIENFQTFKGYILRIYFDTSVKKILHNILSNSNATVLNKIQLFCYEIPHLKDGSYNHIGYIGTLIRFLPLFDVKLHKAKKCIVLDIDNDIRPLHQKIIDNCDKLKINVCYRSRYGYSINKRIFCMDDKIIMDYPIIASFIYQSNVIIPYNIFSNFFDEIFYQNGNRYVTNCNLKKNDYGIDEIFINKIYLKYLYKNGITFSPIILNYYQIYQIIQGYVSIIDTSYEINKYISFLNRFFDEIGINMKFNNKNEILSINKKNHDIITSVLNNFLIDKIALDKAIKFIMKEKELNTKNSKHNIMLNFILLNLTDVKKNKGLFVKISKDETRKIYMDI